MSDWIDTGLCCSCSGDMYSSVPFSNPADRVFASVVRHAEVDDLHRVVGHDEDVARFQVAMNQAAIVCSLQPAARLRQDFDHTFDRETVTGLVNQLVECLSLKQGITKNGFLPAVVELPDVEYLDDVRVADRLEGAAFLVEELEGEGVGELVEGLDGDLPVHRRWIIGR